MHFDVFDKSYKLRDDGAKVRTNFSHGKRRTIVIREIVMRHKLEFSGDGNAAGDDCFLNGVNEIVVGDIQSIGSSVGWQGKEKTQDVRYRL